MVSQAEIKIRTWNGVRHRRLVAMERECARRPTGPWVGMAGEGGSGCEGMFMGASGLVWWSGARDPARRSSTFRSPPWRLSPANGFAAGGSYAAMMSAGFVEGNCDAEVELG